MPSLEDLTRIGKIMAGANGGEWKLSISEQPTPPTKGPSI